MTRRIRKMKNQFFDVTIDEATGGITSIVMPNDENAMNWCASDGVWGRIRYRDAKLISCVVEENHAESVYEANGLSVKFIRGFSENGNFVESCTITNIYGTVLTINRDNFGIEFPFNDRYTNADECMKHHCSTHIWCGHDIAWVNALRMGNSQLNMGLFLTEGSWDCYCQESCDNSNDRGLFVLSPTSFFLKDGESYTFQWELFQHSGKENFFEKLNGYDRFIDVRAKHYTVFQGESIELTIKCHTTPAVFCRGEKLDTHFDGEQYHVSYLPKDVGEYRLDIQCGNVTTFVETLVKIPFAELLEKRVRFIIRNQQCRDPESPLYGAFLVYDNDYDSMYFDYARPDHNACRERMNIPLLLLKYLQLHDDEEVRRSIDLFVKFVFREFYEEETGEVFNTIGKNRDQLRLYNAPGVMLVFAELYFVTRDESYLTHILKLAENYYGIGGKKCYANGLAIGKVMRAFQMAGREEEGKRMMELFHTHVDNIISIGTSYPKHEVNYEQTIVTPAVTHISEMGMLCENKAYYNEAVETHLECLKRFVGDQPSYFLNQISIRYWDDYWFGKARQHGDTLPHHLSCLTARSYIAYAKLTGNTEYIDYAEECIRNCMCLIGDDGRGSAAHVYPYRTNGQRGDFFDPWSNDQDLVLYDALYLNDVKNVFVV